MAAKSTRPTMLAVVTAIIGGLKTKPPAGVRSISVLTQVLSIPQVIVALTAIQTILEAAVTARGALKTAVAAAKVESKAQAAFIKAVKQALIYVYGTDQEGLKGCGIALPKVPAPRSTDQKAITKARAAATRASNASTKQKVKTPVVTVTEVDGTVLGAPAAAPASNPPAPGTPAAPAPVAGGGH
jgi:hypothetical protein